MTKCVDRVALSPWDELDARVICVCCCTTNECEAPSFLTVDETKYPHGVRAGRVEGRARGDIRFRHGNHVEPYEELAGGGGRNTGW